MPWQAGLLFKTSGNIELNQYCSGTLISDSHVITAAHCIDPKDIRKIFKIDKYSQNQIVVRLDDTSEQIYTLAWMKMHENYNKNTMANDIAILKLNRPIEFSDTVNIACLPDKEMDYTGVIATVTDKMSFTGSANANCHLSEIVNAMKKVLKNHKKYINLV